MIKKQLLRYIVPNIFAMLGISFYVLADTFFISLSEGADGITALNLVLPVYGVIYAIGAMIGIGSATSSFATKVGNGIAAGAVGWLLDLGQYDYALAVQPASAVTMIRVGYAVIPLILEILVILIMSRYDLDKILQKENKVS